MRSYALFAPSIRGGGAERVMVNLAQGFTERGLRVDLILAKTEGPYLAQVPPEVRIVDLGAQRVLSALPGLVRYLRRERPQMLLSAMDHANLVALWSRKLAGVPTRVVVSVRTTLSQATANASSLKTRLMPLWIKPFYSWADAIVAVSQGVAEDLIRLTGLPHEKVRVIYNPVVTPRIFAKAEESVDQPWFAPGQPPVVLSVGRLTSAKDYPTLLRAFALVRKQVEIRLMILGEGKERHNLEGLIGELGLEGDVALPGFVENPYKYMKRAKVFVLSSAWEGLPNVLVEALALGTPVVSTDCPSGPAEILKDGKWGGLVRVGDVRALAHSIQEALQEGPRQNTANVASYTLENAVQEYLKVVEEL